MFPALCTARAMRAVHCKVSSALGMLTFAAASFITCAWRVCICGEHGSCGSGMFLGWAAVRIRGRSLGRCSVGGALGSAWGGRPGLPMDCVCARRTAPYWLLFLACFCDIGERDHGRSVSCAAHSARIAFSVQRCKGGVGRIFHRAAVVLLCPQL